MGRVTRVLVGVGGVAGALALPFLAGSAAAAPARAPLHPQPTPQTQLALRPTSGPPGSAFTAVGSDYDPKCEVLLRWDDPAVLLHDPFRPNLDRTFQVDVTVPPTAPAGTHRVRTVCQGADPQASGFQPAFATFTVTTPPTTTTSTTSTTTPPTTTSSTSTTAPPAGTTTTAGKRPPTTAPPGTVGPGGLTTTSAPPVTAPPGDGGDQVRRSAFAAALRRPGDVSTDLTLIAANGGLAALLVLLVAFPSELFNKTYEENEEEVRRWFAALAPLTRPLRAMGRGLARVPGLAFGLFAVAAAVVYGALDPSFGWNVSSLALVVGLLVTVVVATLAFEGPVELYARWRLRRVGTIRVLPGSFVVGAVCVAASRLASFEPGYLFGVIAGFAPLGAELPERDEGRALAVASVCLWVVSLAAWALWVPVASAAARPHPSFATVVLDAALAGTFVAGFETLLLGLVPLRFLDGSKVYAWSRAAWFLLFATAAFAFVHVLLHPEAGYVAQSGRKSLAMAAALFVGFGALSVAFWAWFRYRTPRPPPVPDAPRVV